MRNEFPRKSEKNFVGCVVNAAVWSIPVQVAQIRVVSNINLWNEEMHISRKNGRYGIKLCRVGRSTQHSVILDLRLGFSTLVTTCINKCVIYLLYYPKIVFCADCTHLVFSWIMATLFWHFGTASNNNLLYNKALNEREVFLLSVW